MMLQRLNLLLFLFLPYSSAFSQAGDFSSSDLSIESTVRSLDFDLQDLQGLVLPESRPETFKGILDYRSLEEVAISSMLNGQSGILQVVPGQDAGEELLGSSIPQLVDLASSRFSNFSEAELDCDAAAADWDYLIRHYTHKAGGGPLDRIIREVSSSGIRNEFVSKANDYQRKCLSNVNELPEDLIAADIQSITGFVVVNNSPRCGALRVAENIFITAKHCFFDEDTGDTTLDFQYAKIVTLKSPGALLAINTISQDQNDQARGVDSAPFSLADDYIYLFTTDADDDMPAELHLAEGKTGEEVVLLGYYRFYDSGALFDPAIGEPGDGHWVEGLRWSDSRQCVIGEVTDSCALHYCQSDARFSGSPVFRRSLDNGAISIAGLHVSAMGSNSGCAFSGTSQVGNISISIPNIAEVN